MPSAAEPAYTLDATAAAALHRLAQQWQVSQSEALRRALEQAIEPKKALSPQEKVAALHALQRWVKDKQIDLDEWQQTIRDGRR